MCRVDGKRGRSVASEDFHGVPMPETERKRLDSELERRPSPGCENDGWKGMQKREEEKKEREGIVRCEQMERVWAVTQDGQNRTGQEREARSQGQRQGQVDFDGDGAGGGWLRFLVHACAGP